MKTISKNDISTMDKRLRATFINSLWGFRNLSLIGTKSKIGNINFAPFNSLNHLGADPALASITIRPAEVERHTFENIQETKYFSANNISIKTFKKVHQTSARYPKSLNEAEEVGLTTLFDIDTNTPYLKESSISIILKYQEHFTLEINQTILLIASIEKVLMKKDFIEEDGFVNHSKAKTISCIGLDAYYKSQLIERLPYAKK